MTRPWLIAPAGPAAGVRAAAAAAVPRIETARLVLRAPRLDDWAALEPIYLSDRSVHFGGPFAPEDAWLDFCMLTAGWVLRGCGGWTIEAKADGAVLGMALVNHEYGDPEPELGWMLTAAAEGRGYARESGAALLGWARQVFGAGGFVSYIAPENARSQRLAAALGARRDPAADADGCEAWRHGDAA